MDAALLSSPCGRQYGPQESPELGPLCIPEFLPDPARAPSLCLTEMFNLWSLVSKMEAVRPFSWDGGGDQARAWK